MRSLLPCLLLAVLVVPLLGEASATNVQYPLFARPRPLNRIVEDPWRGSIWLGSDIGLVLLESGSPPQQISFRQGLPSSSVFDIAVTPDRVWLGTALGPVVYDKGDGSIKPIIGPNGSPIQDESRVVYVEGKTVWVGTTTKGLFQVNPQTLQATAVNDPVSHAPFQNPILGLGSDGQEFFITATGYGLVDWHRDTGQAQLYTLHLLGPQPLYGRLVVAPDRVWVGTSGDGVVFLDRATNEMGEAANPLNSNAFSVSGLAQAGQETWFATQSGVSRHDSSNDAWRNWQDIGGPANDVGQVHGLIYAAMAHGLLMAYDRTHDKWINVPWWTAQTSPEQNTIAGCDVVDGKILVGTGGGGALTYDPQTHDWQSLGHQPNGPPDILVWSTVNDGERTWFATQHGAARWNRPQGTWEYYRTDGRNTSVVANSVRQVIPTPEGAWFAVKSFHPPAFYKLPWQKGGAAYWEEASDTWTHYNVTTGLSSDNVTRLALSPGKVWVGSTEGGIDGIDLASHTVYHAYPTDGSVDSVWAMMIHGGILWFGTDKGLWQMDLVTYTATAVPGTQDHPVMSLAWNDGKLWAGTAGAGIYSLDPATATRTNYKAPGLFDIWAYCLLPVGDTMYVGAGSGLERLDLTTGSWYPQMGPFVLTGNPGPASVAISSPADGGKVPAGSLLQVTGTAQVPRGARVQMRFDDGSWVDVQGNSTWHVEFPTANQSREASLNARVLFGTFTLAQTARRVSLVGPEGVVGELGAHHSPILQATEGDQVTFTVTATANLTGTVVFSLPGNGTALRLPLVHQDGSWIAQSPPLEPAGQAYYHIELAAGQSSQVLPDPYDGYGSQYPLTIRPTVVGGFASKPECPGVIRPGTSSGVSVVVQNTGGRAVNMSLDLSGPAAKWGTAPPAQDIDPAASWKVAIPVYVPSSASSGTYTLNGTVLAGNAPLYEFTCAIEVATGGVLGMPTSSLALVLLGLAMAVALRKRA